MVLSVLLSAQRSEFIAVPPLEEILQRKRHEPQ
jgi:hypothetical protein